MPLETLFSILTILAMAGWLALLLSPLSPRWSDRIAGAAIPLLLSAAYAVLLVTLNSAEGGGYGSLAEVVALFSGPEGVLIAWVHFLAFDLFVGAWICRQARESGIRFWFVIPCLAVAFLFGPVGYLMFAIINAIRSRRAA